MRLSAIVFQKGLKLLSEITWKTKEEIEAELNQPNPIEELEKTQTDLLYSLMMNGVI